MSASGWTEKRIEKRTNRHCSGAPVRERKAIVEVSTSLSAHDDTSEVSDLRARIEQQLIAAAKSGRRRVPFGELFEHHGIEVFSVVHWMMRNREDGEGALR